MDKLKENIEKLLQEITDQAIYADKLARDDFGKYLHIEELRHKVRVLEESEPSCIPKTK